MRPSISSQASSAASAAGPASRLSARAAHEPRCVECRPHMAQDHTDSVLNPLVDIGINLAHSDYDRDRDAVIARAVAAGVGQMIVTGSSPASSQQALATGAATPRCALCHCGCPSTSRERLDRHCLGGTCCARAGVPESSPSGNAGSTISGISRPAKHSVRRFTGNSSSRRESASRCFCTSATRMRTLLRFCASIPAR